MTQAENAPLPFDPYELRMQTFNFFRDKQLRDPDFLKRLMETLIVEWDEMPRADREAIAMAQRLVQPNNPEARALATRAYMLAQYIEHEMDTTVLLEELLALPPAEKADGEII